MRAAVLLALAPVLLMTNACSKGGTSGEDAQLNDAAASLDANSADTNNAEIIDEPEDNAGDDSGDNSQ